MNSSLRSGRVHWSRGTCLCVFCRVYGNVGGAWSNGHAPVSLVKCTYSM